MVELVKQNYKENKEYYEKIREDLEKKIGVDVPIDHVGSTAIPKVEYGKNIIDILVGAKNEDEFNKTKQRLINMGYVASEKSRDEIYQFFSSKAEETGSGDVHIHLVILNTQRYRDFIAIREYLLSHEEEAINYSNHKIEILELGKTDRREYKRVKSEYVSKLLDRAREWYKNTNEK